jgi:arginyl-tRNA--protein-N-Asp/Glu arginylyltransferase
MKIVFSESRADYDHYIFPYAIWAFPEAGEVPADFFNHGFLPSSRDLDRFYLCRQVRVSLRKYRPSSENRRILRKGEGITVTLVPRAEFEFTPARRDFYKTYADIRFGKDTMSYERLDLLFGGKITSHLLVFTDTRSGAEVGTVTLYLEPNALAYYYYAFYDLNYYDRNLGMFMMTSAAALFKERGFNFLYLGSCYSRNALYKTQFAGAEFFNGVRWSANLEELKYLIRRDQKEQQEHLLENEEYREDFYQSDLRQIAATSQFRVELK